MGRFVPRWLDLPPSRLSSPWASRTTLRGACCCWRPGPQRRRRRAAHSPREASDPAGRCLSAMCLASLWQHAVVERDDQGCLPIHNVRSFTTRWPNRRYPSWPDTAQMLVMLLYPESAQQTNDAGEIPLHAAAQSNSLPLVQFFFVEEYPEGVQRRSDDGSLPLRKALCASMLLIRSIPERESGYFHSISPTRWGRWRSSNSSLGRGRSCFAVSPPPDPPRCPVPRNHNRRTLRGTLPSSGDKLLKG